MISKVWSLFDKLSYAPIIILGTGRSGTHWIANTLAAHPAIRATIEKSPQFDWVMSMALDARRKDKLLPKLLRRYKWEVIRSTPRRYLDKSHPAIWLAEDIKAALPRTQFVGIERDPFATVASMLRHTGVSDWHRRWREFPIPNAFLGIDEDNAATYDRLSMAKRCALRWAAHSKEMVRLRQILGSSMIVTCYEALVNDTREELIKLQRFLRLQEPIRNPHVKRESLHKWHDSLSREQIQEISQVVGFGPR